MKTILFYAINGVGLGHLQRVRLIAEALRRKNVKIILATTAPAFWVFGRFFHHCVKLTSPSDELFKSPGAYKAKLLNAQKFISAIRRFKPNLIVADFYLNTSFSLYPLIYGIDKFSLKSVFIWRMDEGRAFCRDLKNEIIQGDYFQKIILPHSKEELKSLLPPSAIRAILADPRFEICGPIFRKIKKDKLSICRQKYKTSPRDFLITITLGGGGSIKIGHCDSAAKIINNFLTLRSRLTSAIPNLKVAIITGPYFPDFKRKFPSNFKIVRFEKNLPELMAISSLVITPAGYNTCNELIEARTPAILTPLLRGNREQFERAYYFKKKGVAEVLENVSPQNLSATVLKCRKNLGKMKENFKNFSEIKPGNQRAAKIILNLIK